MTASNGPALFARYAYPPNALGYCGPPDARELLEAGSGATDRAAIAALARRFDGAWPYLQLIAAANRIADPLDERVVRAYWVGNPLLDHVDRRTFARFLEETFGRRAGRGFGAPAAAVLAGAAPHHNVHVFSVYPWSGMLRLGHTVAPMRVLEGCRIRWGTVVDVAGGSTLVRSRPLAWDGGHLALAAPRTELVTVSRDGYGFVGDLQPGDLVSMHWDWVCDRLDADAAWALHANTCRALDAANAFGVRAPAFA